mgnify:CR=1 FL=1
MPITTQKLPSFNAIAPGSTASLKVPATVTYAAIDIQVTHDVTGTPTLMSLADMKTKIERVRLMIDGHAAWNITGKNLVEWNDYYNQNAADNSGILSLVFAQGYLDNPMNEDALALGTASKANGKAIQNVTVEVELASDVVAPKLEATATAYTGANRPLGQFIQLEDTHYSASGVGKFEISDLPVVGQGVGIKALHFTTDNISHVEMKANNSILHEFNREVNDAVIKRRTGRTVGRTAQTDFTHVDIGGNRLADVIDTSGFRDFRLKLEMTEATAFTVLHELIVTL